LRNYPTKESESGVSTKIRKCYYRNDRVIKEREVQTPISAKLFCKHSRVQGFKGSKVKGSTFDPPKADKCLLASGELDVRCSFFQSILDKNNLALMAQTALPFKS
jgi:hypothetical protein